MHADRLIPVHEHTDVATVRREALQAAARARFSQEDAGALAVVVTEAASNQIKHGGGGDLILRELGASGSRAIEVIALDSGKGMSNVARCFADGFTTAGSPGNGLGAIVRLSSFHDIYTQDGKGTVLLARVGASPDISNTPCRYSAISIPYPGETACGDVWDIEISPNRVRILVADGLGHGILAAEASAASLPFIDLERYAEPVNVVENAHLRLKSTRGAAIGVLDIDRENGTATFAGLGNIAGSIVPPEGPRRQMVSMNGTLGHEMRAARQYQYPLPESAVAIVHSDGLSTHWAIDKYPGLLQRHPGVIAGVLFRDFRRVRDDATVVVVRIES